MTIYKLLTEHMFQLFHFHPCCKIIGFQEPFEYVHASCNMPGIRHYETEEKGWVIHVQCMGGLFLMAEMMRSHIGCF